MISLAIARMELLSLLRSPLAWATLSSVCALLAWLFLLRIDQYLLYQSQLLALADPPGVTELVVTPLFGSAGLILIMVIPVITMRCFAEQERAQTLTLLTSAPVSLTSIVVGKYLGICAFLGLILLLLLAMPLSLIGATTLDFGLLGAATLGIVLLLNCYLAVGLWASSLTQHPAAAAMLSFGILLTLWLLESASAEPGDTAALAQLSTLTHFQALLSGLVNTADLAYFVTLSLLALGLTVLRLHHKRHCS